MNTEALEAAQVEFASKRTIEAALKVAKIANEIFIDNATHTNAHASAEALRHLITALEKEKPVGFFSKIVYEAEFTPALVEEKPNDDGDWVKVYAFKI